MTYGIRIFDPSGTLMLDSSKNPGLVVDFVRTSNITASGSFSQSFTNSQYSGCTAVAITVFANAAHLFNATVSGSTVTISGFVSYATGGNAVYAGAWIIKPTVVNS